MASSRPGSKGNAIRLSNSINRQAQRGGVSPKLRAEVNAHNRAAQSIADKGGNAYRVAGKDAPKGA